MEPRDFELMGQKFGTLYLSTLSLMKTFKCFENNQELKMHLLQLYRSSFVDVIFVTRYFSLEYLLASFD